MMLHHLYANWRSLTKNRGFAVLNIAGLAIGIAVAIIVGLWINDELSYNKSFDHYDRIGQLKVQYKYEGGGFIQWAASPPYAAELREQFGEDFEHVLMFSQPWERALAVGRVSVLRKGYFAEPGAAEMLSLEMIEGSRTGLTDANSILLSQSAARGLFGDEEAIGKIIRIDNKADVTVAGVYEDIPTNSDFSDMQFLGSWELYAGMSREWIRLDDWRQTGFLAFAEIKDGRTFTEVSNKIRNVKLQHSSPEEAKKIRNFFLSPCASGGFIRMLVTDRKLQELNWCGCSA